MFTKHFIPEECLKIIKIKNCQGNSFYSFTVDRGREMSEMAIILKIKREEKSTALVMLEKY